MVAPRHGPVVGSRRKAAPRDGLSAAALLRLADALQPEIAAAFLTALTEVRESVDLIGLAEALAAGDLDAAEIALQVRTIEAALGRQLPPVVGQAFREAGELAAAALDEARGGVGITFTTHNPAAERYAEETVGERITAISTETRDGIREDIRASVAAEVGDPRTVARRIRDRIGLRADQVQAVQTFRDGRLADGDDPVDAEVKATRYAAQQLQARSQTIAQYETMDALNAGAMESWRQAVDGGWLDAEGLRLEWVATDDDRVDQDCEDLDGVTVAWGEEFAPGVERPPLHIGCRCTVSALPLTADEIAAQKEPEEKMVTTRFYKTAAVQAVDRDRREIEFILTADEIDRVEERVLPSGGKITLPVPLCDNHDPNAVLGHVYAITPRQLDSGDLGLLGRAHFLPVGLNARADEVYRMVQHGSLHAVSIGFRALEIAPGPPVTFTRWELLEVSVVPIGACAQCRITGKSYAPGPGELPFSLDEIAGALHRAVPMAVKSAMDQVRLETTGELWG